MSKETFTTMTMRRIRLKFHAKRALPGNWLRSMLLVLLTTLAASLCLSYLVQTVDVSVLVAENPTPEMLLNAFLPQAITKNYLLLVGVSLLLYWLILSPLAVGTRAFFIGVARGAKSKLPSVFTVFADLTLVLRSMGLVLWTSVLKLFWWVLFFALPCLLLYAAQLLSSVLLQDLSLLVFLAAAAAYSIRITAYTPAIFLFAEDPSIGIFGAVKQSVRITRGNLLEYFVFELSFLPYQFLVALSGMLVTLLFEPYYLTASAVFVDSLRKRHDPDWICPSGTDNSPEKE